MKIIKTQGFVLLEALLVSGALLIILTLILKLFLILNVSLLATHLNYEACICLWEGRTQNQCQKELKDKFRWIHPFANIKKHRMSYQKNSLSTSYLELKVLSEKHVFLTSVSRKEIEMALRSYRY